MQNPILAVNNLLTVTVVFMFIVLLSNPSYAKGKRHSSTEWAKVTHYEPIIRSVEKRIPEKNCWYEDVQYQESSGHYRSHTGTVLGGIIGGALGNAVGHRKKNKQIGTAVGALLGATIGHDLSHRESRHNRPITRHHTERRCEVSETIRYEDEVVAYRVWYRYHGETYKTRMTHKPGKRIKVRVTVEPV